MSEQYNAEQFIDGQRDCREGVPHKAGMSESYDAGYATQFQLEAIQGAEQ